VAAVRAYGNAIDPWVAKAVIEDYCSAKGILSDLEAGYV
jgi:hypothetical protein